MTETNPTTMRSRLRKWAWYRSFRRAMATPYLSLLAMAIAIVVATSLSGDRSAVVIVVIVFIIMLLLFAMTALLIWWSAVRLAPASHWIVDHARYEWTILDRGGQNATLHKSTSGFCLADDIAFLQEYSYGDGANAEQAHVMHSGGDVVGVLNDNGRIFVGIQLKHPYTAGMKYDFEYQRTIRDAFRGQQEWVAVKADFYWFRGPIDMVVNFPPGAAVTNVRFEAKRDGYGLVVSNGLTEGQNVRVIEPAGDGESYQVIRKTIELPLPNHEYRIRWTWDPLPPPPPTRQQSDIAS